MVSSLNYIDNYTLPAPVLHIHGVVWLGSASGWGEPLAGAVETGRKRVGSRSVDLWGLRVGLTVARPMAHNVGGVYLRFLANPLFAMKNGFFVFKAEGGKLF